MHIPLLCTEWKWENANLRPCRHAAPPTRPEEPALSVSAAWGVGQRSSHPGQTVAVATLIEYAVATYGRERLPAFVAGLGQYERWEMLIPAVYGVSAAEFEAGWQAYLTAQYGVATAVHH